jgi:O-antigen ligase
MTDSKTLATGSGIARSAALGLYGLGVFAFIAHIWTNGQALGVAMGWVVYWCLMSLGFAATPRLPLVGVCCYVMLAYGMSSHAPELNIMLSIRLLDAAVALVLVGWMLSDTQRPPKPAGNNYLVVLGGVFLAWLVFSLASAVLRGTPYGTFLRHDPSGYLQAAALCFVTWKAVKTRADCALLAAVIGLTVLGRVVLQGKAGTYLESYVASLLVIGAPLALLGMVSAQNRLMQYAFGAAAVGMLVSLAMTQNRAAAVASVAVVAVFIWQSRRTRLGKWLVAMVIAVAIGLMFAPSSYVDRFRALLDPAQTHATAGLDRGTAAERLELWSAGWQMAMDQPLTGVGPGNYPAALGIYLPGKGLLAAHSNYMQMLAEAGFVGLALYLAFFWGVLLMLDRTRRTRPSQWQRSSAQMLQLALVAYLIGGIFNSRQDFVLAYILAGWALALRDIKS